MAHKTSRSIQEILDEVRRKLADLEQRIAALRLEEETLAKAEAIAQRYGTLQPDMLILAGEQVTVIEAKASKKPRSRSGAPRPKGVPTLPEMITFAIRSATKEGKRGLTGKEILEHIDKTYWKGVSSNLVLPTAWRLAKAKRLKRSGELYLLMPEDEKNSGQSANSGPQLAGSAR